jgi:aspartate 1-decarboxylase
MQRHLLKSKIHRATVTGCDPDYVGSVTIDRDLMDQADLIPNEQVHVWDIDNGARMVTYAIAGDRGSGDVRINGAAARLVREGDKVIIASYGTFDDADLERYSPVVVHVDAYNRTLQIDSRPDVLLSDPPSPDEIPGSLTAPDSDTSFGLSSGLDLS